MYICCTCARTNMSSSQSRGRNSGLDLHWHVPLQDLLNCGHRMACGPRQTRAVETRSRTCRGVQYPAVDELPPDT